MPEITWRTAEAPRCSHSKAVPEHPDLPPLQTELSRRAAYFSIKIIISVHQPIAAPSGKLREVINTEKYFIFLKPPQGCYIPLSGILQSPKWATEHPREMKGTEYLVIIALMLWLPALALSAPSCRNSALSRIQELGFVSPVCASPFPEGTTAVCQHWVLKLYCGSALQTDPRMTKALNRIHIWYTHIIN